MQEEISFGIWLRKQRRTWDLSRQAFVDQIDCTEVTLRRIEGETQTFKGIGRYYSGLQLQDRSYADGIGTIQRYCGYGNLLASK